MRRKRIKRWGKRTIVGAVAAIAMIAIGLGMLQLMGNFHTVVQGELYRSAQVSPNDLHDYVREHGIRSVINLRGANAGSDWYDDEIATAKALGLHHYDFRMSSSRQLQKEEALQLIAMMRDAPKPLLIHCRAGADRTGLASALYMAAVAKGTEWQAEKQLWLTYGHVPLWFTGAYAMNDTFESLEPYLGFEDS